MGANIVRFQGTSSIILGKASLVIDKAPDLTDFVVAEGLDGKKGAPGSARLAEACHRTPIHSDITMRAGAKNLFLAPSTEIAVAADNAVAAMTEAVERSGVPLPFELVCFSHSEHFCDDARHVLAKTLERKIEYADLCIEADACLNMDGFYDERSRCVLGIYFRAKDMTRVDRVKINCDSESVD